MAPPHTDPLEQCIRRCSCTNAPPPCITTNCCWKPCEANSCCKLIGTCGLSVTDQRRKHCMYFAALTTTIGILLSFVAVLSLNASFEVIQSTAWTSGAIERNGTRFQIYVGLQSAAVRSIRGTISTETIIDWKTTECEDLLFSEACSSCREVALSTGTPSIVAIVTGFPQLFTNLLRSLSDQDVRCQKTFGIITGCWGFFSTLVALNAFAFSCRRSLDAHPGQEWFIGPGLALATIACFFKIIDVTIHSLVPVPEDPPAHKRLSPYQLRSTNDPPKKQRPNGTPETNSMCTELSNVALT